MASPDYDQPRPLLQFFMWTVMLPVGSVMLSAWYLAQATQKATKALHSRRRPSYRNVISARSQHEVSLPGDSVRSTD
jgi:hypothetical protein